MPDSAPARSAVPQAGSVDVCCIGETMLSFAHLEGDDFLAIPAGAESNVAIGAAELGLSARWVSRLGDDPQGRSIARALQSRGVDVSVVWDEGAPTGAMVKYPGVDGASSTYYRSQSAARLLGPADADRVGSARWLHTTGITAAISPTAGELVDHLLTRRPVPDAGTSFDVNYRASLWPSSEVAAHELTTAACLADLIFIGDDEAEALFGSARPSDLARRLLRSDNQELVLKRGAVGASVITRGGRTTVAALRCDVVDVTGAGDAFAAGYIAGRCRGWDAASRLRLGHFMAARVIGVVADASPPLGVAEAARLAPDALMDLWSHKRGNHGGSKNVEGDAS